MQAGGQAGERKANDCPQSSVECCAAPFPVLSFDFKVTNRRVTKPSAVGSSLSLAIHYEQVILRRRSRTAVSFLYLQAILLLLLSQSMAVEALWYIVFKITLPHRRPQFGLAMRR